LSEGAGTSSSFAPRDAQMRRESVSNMDLQESNISSAAGFANTAGGIRHNSGESMSVEDSATNTAEMSDITGQRLVEVEHGVNSYIPGTVNNRSIGNNDNAGNQ
jgi:hypothetical protein